MPASRRSRSSPPSAEEVWRRVHDFAEAQREHGQPVLTLQHEVENRITAVDDEGVERLSAQTRTGRPSRISRAELCRTWEDLLRDGSLFTTGRTVFTPALLHRALPEWVESCGNMISLAGFGDIPDAAVDYASVAAEGGAGSRRAGARQPPRESAKHWALKHYIHQRPREALAGLAGGPWTEAKLEYVLPTRDRIDVVATDGKGCWCLIEVKPYVRADDRRWYAQAAKYRCIWQIVWPGASLRSVLVAPHVERVLAQAMRENFDIESLQLEVPASFVPPPQPF